MMHRPPPKPVTRLLVTRSCSTALLAAATALVAALAVAPPAAAANVQVTVGPGATFSPAQVSIQPGDSVTWTNSGGFHNVRADDDSFRCAQGCDGGSGDGAPSSAAWSVTLTFNTPGSIPYYCEVHGAPGGVGMSGVVHVGSTGGGEPGMLRFSAAGYGAGEASGSRLITVERAGGEDGMVSVRYATANGSATAGEDYSPASGTLTWADQDGAAKTFSVPILDDAAVEGDETVRLSLSNPTGGAALGTPSTATLTLRDDDMELPPPPPPPEDCVEDETTLCLLQGRFQVRVHWRTASGKEGEGQVVPFRADDSGLFYFFDQENWEMLVKMVEACGLNQHFWVFYAATTDVELSLTVTDTVAGRTETYSNPLGMAAEPVQDTTAFDTCP